MKKIEQVWKEILYQAVELKNRRMSQLELSKKLGFSLSTVNLALKKLEKTNAVSIKKMGFNVLSIKKILYLWASERNLQKDIIFKARIEMPVKEIERILPDIVYAAYLAYKLKFNDVPADYSEVYVYANEVQLQEIKKRLKKIIKEDSKHPNFFALRPGEINYGKTDTIGQIFADLWNLKEWYASDFLKALENKINSMPE